MVFFPRHPFHLHSRWFYIWCVSCISMAFLLRHLILSIHSFLRWKSGRFGGSRSGKRMPKQWRFHNRRSSCELWMPLIQSIIRQVLKLRCIHRKCLTKSTYSQMTNAIFRCRFVHISNDLYPLQVLERFRKRRQTPANYAGAMIAMPL